MATPQRFVVTIDGIDHDVIVDAKDGVTRVEVDGAGLVVRAAADGPALVRTADGVAQTRVHLDPDPRPTQAHAAGRVHELVVRTRREAALDAAAGTRAGAGGDDAHVTAPMPGRVVRVLVGLGDAIERDAALVIVEAMKMENEVRARGRGKVAKVLVAAGDTVEAGQLMCELALDEE